MVRIWCRECGTFIVGELDPEVSLLEQGHILRPPHPMCTDCPATDCPTKARNTPNEADRVEEATNDRSE